MKLTISPLIFKKFPKLRVGIVIAKNIDNTGSEEQIYHLLEEVEQLVKASFVPTELAIQPLISPWRTAYSEFGAKPSKHKTSIEAMMKRIFKGEKIPKINKAVDIYNYLSLKHTIPMGADDLDKVEGDISLTISDGAEVFRPLGSDEIEHPEKGEVIYKDHRRALCRRWNWRDCEDTKITEETKNMIFYVEGLPPVTEEKLKKACEEVVDLVQTFCKGEAKYFILDVGEPDIEF